VAPTRHEPVKVAKSFLGPGVEAAFVRIAGRELHDYQRSGNKEEEGSEDPKTDRRRAVVRCGRDPARPQYCRQVEEHQIAQPKFAAQELSLVSGVSYGS